MWWNFSTQPGAQLVHRVPPVGSGDFKLGSQVIVRESQVAVFFRDGKALDVFGPGRHTLSTQNIPILSRIYQHPVRRQQPVQGRGLLRQHGRHSWT